MNNPWRKKVVWFKTGEAIPIDAKYLKTIKRTVDYATVCEEKHLYEITFCLTDKKEGKKC